MSTLQRLIFAAFLVLAPLETLAGWSASAAVNNPPGANIGVNFMYLWTDWVFEAGVGRVSQNTGTDKNGNNTQSVSVLGDVNFKYLFGSSTFRPFLEVGAGSGVSATTSSGNLISAGVGGGFGGAGFYVMGSSIYGYLGLVSGGGNGNLMYGLGFNF